MITYLFFRRFRGSLFAGISLFALLIIAGVAGCFPLLSGMAWASQEDTMQERIRNRIETSSFAPSLVAWHEPVHARAALFAFYEKRGYRPVWIENGSAGALADSVVAVVRDADREGLDRAHYHFPVVSDALKKARAGDCGPADLVDIELLLTDMFLIYASHLLAGALDPKTIDPEWFANRRSRDLAALLEEANRQKDVRSAIQSMLPPQEGYSWLKSALARYRQIQRAGGWQDLAAGEKLEIGTQGERVRHLRERLRVTGDLEEIAGGGDQFDEALREAVVRFQKRHGLGTDGVVGEKTIEALNRPPIDRIRQISVNLERWRWLPQDLGGRHILVNVANFDLDYIENREVVLSMRTIVGRDYRRTPVFTGSMTYMVVNPSWEVPHSIATQDILPQVLKNPAYLDSMGFKVLSGWGHDEKQISSRSIDWKSITRSHFPFRLRQKPGPANALGRIKFMFPNEHNVYLHDTPGRSLFEKTDRAFSSGCIRVEKPLELAGRIAAGEKVNLDEILAGGREKTVRLSVAVPVHILYWTAWVDAAGTVHFRKDLYGRDTRVLAALAMDPPEAVERP